MKKTIILLFAITIFTNIYSQNNQKDFTLYMQYSDLKFYYDPVEPIWGQNIIQRNDDILYSYNSFSREFILFNTDYEIADRINLNENYYIPDTIKRMFFGGNYLVIQGIDNNSVIIDVKKREFDSFIQCKNSEIIYIDSNIIIIYDNGLFFQINSLDAFSEPLLSTNKMELFDQNTNIESSNILFRDNILFDGIKILTTNINIFVTYYDIDTSINFPFIGSDVDGNYYWGNANGIIIFNVNGEILDSFNTNAKYPVSYPFIDFDGNIYYFNYNTEKMTTDLYRMLRDW